MNSGSIGVVCQPRPQSKDETLGRMVVMSVEILGFKSLADHWGLQRWRQKHNSSDSSRGGGERLQTGDLLPPCTSVLVWSI
jgi:hypothetical protein